MKNDSSIQVIDRAFQIIEMLSNHSENISLAEICALTGIPKGTAFRILNALIKNGYVSKNAYGQYSLTFRTCMISWKILKKTNAVTLAKPYIDQLSSIVNQTVTFVAREKNEVVYIYRQSAPAQIAKLTSTIGMRRPMHTCATGKSILAALSDDEISAYWDAVEKPQITPYTITTPDALLKEIAEIRKKGYAMDNQENTLGICCIAISIKDYMGKPSYAISINFQRDAMPDDKIKELVPFLLSTGGFIASALGTQ